MKLLPLFPLAVLAAQAETIIPVKQQSFKTHLSENKIFIVHYQTPTCANCKFFAPEFETAAKALVDYPDGTIKFGTVDCTSEKELCDEQEVSGYPVIKIYRDNTSSDYEGARKSPALVQHLKDLIGAEPGPVSIAELTPETLNAAISKSQKTLVAFVTGTLTHVSSYDNELRDLSPTLKTLGVTLGWLSCQQHKDTCDKYKVVHTPTLKYFNKEEEKEFTSVTEARKSILADSPSVGDQKVVEITAESFKTVVTDQAVILVAFIAPWCGYSPIFEEAAKLLPTDKKYQMGRVDCTVTPTSCQQYGVTGYPTIKLFRKGSILDYYGDRSVDAFLNFLKSEGQVEVDPPSDVVMLHQENFHEMTQGKNVLIAFTASWCGFCKKLAPEFAKAATALKGTEYVVAKVECTIDSALCFQNEVVGYPSIKYYRQSGGVIDYDGDRTAQSFVDFVKGGYKQYAEQVEVMQLTKDNFTDFVTKDKQVLVAFVASWCGFCRRLAPELGKLTSMIKDTNFVVAKLECPENPTVCIEQGVTGYPTLFYFNKGNKKEFNGERTAEALLEFMQGILSVEERPSEVIHLNSANYQDFLKKSKSLMVKYFAPWCGHCTKLAPEYAEAASLLYGTPHVLAKVDCTLDPELCFGEEVLGYPTMKIFKDGKYTKDYGGARTAEAIYEEMTGTPMVRHTLLPWDVRSLEMSNFTEFIKEQPLRMVMFGAPWCAHTRALSPEFDKAAILLGDTEIRLGRVDCSKQSELCTQQNIRGYPTIIAFKDSITKDYAGERKAQPISSFLRKMLLPQLSNITAEQLESFTKADQVVVVGFYDPNQHSQQHEQFSSLATELHEQVVFGHVSDPAVAEKEKLTAPAVVIYKSFDEPKVISNDFGNLKELITMHKRPALEEITPQNFGAYSDAPLPLAYLFLQKDDLSLLDGVREVAQKVRGRVNFVWIDAQRYATHAASLNLEAKWPAFAIMGHNPKAKYPMDQSLPVTVARIEDWTTRFIDGTARPRVKSEPLPPPESNVLIKKVVGENFEQIALSTQQDVVILFTAPWCETCKTLERLFKITASLFVHSDEIVFGQMDATNNDVPPSQGFQISSFPCIKLFRAMDNIRSDFGEDRSVDGLLRFIKMNSHFKVHPLQSDAHDEL